MISCGKLARLAFLGDRVFGFSWDTNKWCSSLSLAGVLLFVGGENRFNFGFEFCCDYLGVAP